MHKSRHVKKIIFIAAFICILCISIKCAEYVLRPAGDEDVCLAQIKAFHLVDKNSLDVIAYGSSHGWLGFDSNEFAKVTGYNTYNYGCYWQSFNTTWLFFHDSLKTQAPKIALLETGRVADYLTGLGVEGQVLYTKEIGLSREKMVYLKQCFGDDTNAYLSYAFPMDIFHGNWKNLSSDNFFRKSEVGEFSKSHGQNVSYSEFPIKTEYIGIPMTSGTPQYDEILNINPYEGGESGQKDIPERCRRLLDEIYSVCQKNNIILVLYTIPYAGDYNYSEALSNYSQNENCYYINLFDYLDEMELDSSRDFCDADHLNANGAKKVSRFLADYIVKNVK